MDVVTQKRKWRDASNERRKALYREDKQYRDKVREQSRTSSRKAHGGLQVDRADIILSSMTRLISHAIPRKLIDSDAVVHSITTSELAPLLGLSDVVVLHGWQRSNRFPKPKLQAVVGRTHAKVYTLPEAEKLLSVMAQHFRTKNYLNQDDRETIRMLFKAMS